MAYRFKFKESLSEAVPRILVEQIERAGLEFSASGDAAKSIHETRKCLKRIRAVLRLVRPSLEDGVYQTEMSRYRSIAGLLSAARDRDVMSGTLLQLSVGVSPSQATAIAEVKSALMTRPASETSDNNIRQLVAELLEEAKQSAATIKIDGDIEAIGKGLRDCYRKGRHLQKSAYDDGSDEAFHDLRKSVQLHWRHMQLLQRAWPDLFAARIEAARALSQVLGDTQDLAVLNEAIKGLGDLPDGAGATVEALSRARQRELLRTAEPKGEQLFAGSGRSFAKSVLKIWHAAVQCHASDKAD